MSSLSLSKWGKTHDHCKRIAEVRSSTGSARTLPYCACHDCFHKHVVCPEIERRVSLPSVQKCVRMGSMRLPELIHATVVEQ